MNNITIVFCEGQHDIAFLSKLLFLEGYKKYDKKLSSFCSPFGEQFMSILKETNISDRKLGFQTVYKVPSVSLYKDSNLVLFHNMGGDGRTEERKEVLKVYRELKGDDDFSSNYEFDYKFLYFLDADDISITERVASLNDELSLDTPIVHGNVITSNNSKWGCYIFHDTEDSGVLEDLLLSLMKPSNERIFEESKKFIDTIGMCENRQKEYVCHKDTYKTAKKFKEKKSLISIAGQLQFSSMSNAVIIANSDYIKRSDIVDNPYCKDIISLFN